MTVLTPSSQRNLFFDSIRRLCRWRTPTSPGLSAQLRDGRRKISGLGSRVEVLAFADQAVVSATSFLAMVMVGRYSNPAELGAYALGISVLAALYTMQGSLISLPYSIQRFRVLGTPAQHAGSALAHSVLLSTMVAIVLAVTALGLYAFGTGSQLFALALVLAGVAPFGLLREFERSFSFTHLHVAQSLILDMAVAAMQTSMLAWLGWTGRMSAVTAFGALGASCGVVAIGLLCFARAEFAIEIRQAQATLKLSWGLGKWLILGQLANQLRRFSVYWVSVIIAGPAVTGVYAACMSVVSFANPVMFGLGNILTPKAVLAWKEGGAAGLLRQIVRDTLLLGLMMASLCVVVLFAGETVMRFLYHGKDYEGHAHILATLAFATFVAAIGLPANSALAATERPRAIVGVGVVASIVTVVLVWWLMRGWGLTGAAYGSLAGNLVSSVGLWLAFLALVPRTGDTAEDRKRPAPNVSVS
jgi:O-antigen/teichoic acid export membrane protein